MTQTIVVPLDQSDVAELALPVAEVLARQLEARLHLVSVLEISPDYADWIHEKDVEEPWKAERESAEAYLAKMARRLEPLDASTQVLIGLDPAVEIDSTVSELGNALVVMSSHGRSGIQRLVLGSIATRMVQLASYPLIVVPSQCSEFGYPDSIDRILLTLDGSSFAEYAQEVALNVFAGRDLSFHLLRVVDPVEAVDTGIDERARVYLDRAAENLRARGYEVTSAVESAYASDIANRIAVNAHANDCDLITLATHGRTGFSRWYFGSVADGVLRTATKPVLVVHPSEDVIARAPESRSRQAREG